MIVIPWTPLFFNGLGMMIDDNKCCWKLELLILVEVVKNTKTAVWTKKIKKKHKYQAYAFLNATTIQNKSVFFIK